MPEVETRGNGWAFLGTLILCNTSSIAHDFSLGPKKSKNITSNYGAKSNLLINIAVWATTQRKEKQGIAIAMAFEVAITYSHTCRKKLKQIISAYFVIFKF